jgi:pyruvate dehydrogenase E2 component (dihydrolipoamide acetyltransferase)
MATLVPIPKLGQSEETVAIAKWRVKEGDVVKKGDILFDVETDKAVLEVESQFAGTVLKVLAKEGVDLPVMSPALVIGQPGEALPEMPAVATPQPAPAAPAPAPAPTAAPSAPPVAKSATPAVAAPVAGSVAAPTPVAAAPAAARPSPRARRFAQDYLINLAKVPATGGSGRRITARDVQAYLKASGYLDRKITPAAFNLAKEEGLELLAIAGTGDGGRVTLADVRAAVAERPRELSAMRKVIAQRLTQSKQQIPHFYVTAAIDLTDLLALRQELKAQGLEVGVNTFILKAVALSLKDFPMLNATTDGKTVRHWARVHLGVAVSLENGLVVPVVRDADRKALDELQAEVADLAAKARAGKLAPDEMKGGTFTISNMGMLGVDNFAAIINPGETGILAVSAAKPTPVVRDGQVVVRQMMNVTLSADHRAVDGADGARFVNALRTRLEDTPAWRTMA